MKSNVGPLLVGNFGGNSGILGSEKLRYREIHVDGYWKDAGVINGYFLHNKMETGPFDDWRVTLPRFVSFLSQ